MPQELGQRRSYLRQAFELIGPKVSNLDANVCRIAELFAVRHQFEQHSRRFAETAKLQVGVNRGQINP